MSFDDLGNNPTALKAVQSNTYNTVYTYMQLTPASGAFYYLNTTTKPEKGSYSGIYLKFKNLSTENTINTDISMYHGISSVARENKISLNSTWTLETEKGLFREIDEMMEQKNHENGARRGYDLAVSASGHLGTRIFRVCSDCKR